MNKLAKLKVIGAGRGRTGTSSLKIALEHLLGGNCYHMDEVFKYPDHVPTWHKAARGEMPDWKNFLRNYSATIDWPAAAFWPELHTLFPSALVLLSTRDPEEWWESAKTTIMSLDEAGSSEWRAMVKTLDTNRFFGCCAGTDRDTAIMAFEKHNNRVRTEVDPSCLLEWQPGDGWEPICAALDMPVPDITFPNKNNREEWLSKNSMSR